MNKDLSQQIVLLLREVVRNKLLVIGTFVVITAAAMVVGLNWPKVYRSSTTIHVESRNIIDPLMQGRAVRPDMSDQVENAREVLNSRSLLAKVLIERGTISDSTPPAEEERLINSIRSRVSIVNPGPNLIHIQYEDSDPERTFLTTKTLAKVFIDEMLAAQERESSAAYHFIDRQVKKYEQQLKDTQTQLAQMRERDPDAQPGAGQQVSQRISMLQNTIDDLEQRIEEARIRERSLTKQLSGEAESATVSSQVQDSRDRIAELRSELDALRLKYQDTHPDIVMLKQQIASAEEQLQAAESSQEAEASSAQSPSAGREGPVFQQLQQRLYQVRTEYETLQARLADAKRKLSAAQSRAARVQELHAKVENLTQDYQVNRDIYEDLMRRRENARVSMNLDNEQQGLSLRVQEPAYLPHQPSGPRLLHFAMGGLFLGGVLPVGMLFGWLTVDPRIRSSDALPEIAQKHLLETVPHLSGPREKVQQRRSLIMSVLVVCLTIAAVAAVFILRANGGT